jgi:hypothetical protein
VSRQTTRSPDFLLTAPGSSMLRLLAQSCSQWQGLDVQCKRIGTQGRGLQADKLVTLLTLRLYRPALLCCCRSRVCLRLCQPPVSLTRCPCGQARRTWWRR